MNSFFFKFNNQKIIINHSEASVFKKTSGNTTGEDWFRKWFKMCETEKWYHVSFVCNLVDINTSVLEYAKEIRMNTQKASTPNKNFSKVMLVDDYPYFSQYYSGDNDIQLAMFRKLNDNTIFSIGIEAFEPIDTELLLKATEQLKEKLLFLIRNIEVK